MNKLDGQSKDIVAENIEKLKEIFPSIVKENKIDFEELELLLGEYINRNKEQYSFTWNGKTEATKLAQKRSTGTLRPCPEESIDWDTTKNLYIEGDNLEVLKLLQASYNGRIKMIYIDPPYNTGHDFVYKDNFEDNIQNYKEVTGQAQKSNADTDGRYHTNWLNMMYPRLKLARNLLDKDGVIFISIDDNEQANLKKLCDDVFGDSNFICQLIWRKKTGASDAVGFSVISEYILVYVKNISYVQNTFTEDLNAHDVNRYKLSDEYESRRGKYYIDNLDRGGIHYSDSLNYPITCPDGTITYPNGRKKFTREGWTWTWGKEKLEWGLKTGFIEFRKSNLKDSGWAVCYKNYLNVNNKDELVARSAPHKNMIMDILNTSATLEMQNIFGAKVFQYTKPTNLIKQLLSYVKNKDYYVMDFFSGSATTAHSVMHLNAEDNGKRKYICVQIPELVDEKSEAYNAGYTNICEIAKERIRRAGKKIKEENPDKDIDVGFKVLKLDSSNLKKWDNTPTKDEEEIANRLQMSIDYIQDGRTEMDLVYEVMLKYGIDLTYPVIQTENKKAYIIQAPDYRLLICSYPNLTLEDVDNFAEENVGTYLFADRCFVDDNLLINTQEILKAKNKDMRLF